MSPQEARDDEREALVRDLTADDAWRAIVEMNAPTLAAILHADGYRKHPEPEITDEMVDRAGRVVYPRWDEWDEDDDWAAGIHQMIRESLEAALRLPVGEGEQ